MPLTPPVHAPRHGHSPTRRWLGIVAAAVSWLAALPTYAATSPEMLVRFPTVSPDTIAFVAGGNLWSVPRAGGLARRLTDDPGQVFMPHFSPDGGRIAFTWRHGSTCDVYVVSAAGGTPVRLTHGPTQSSYDNLVTGWTPDGLGVMFLSERRTAFHRYDVYRVAASGGLAVPFGLGHAGLASMAADGQSIVYDWSFRNLGHDRWKRYLGGQAGELFRYDLHNHALTRLTDWQGTDTAPMLAGERLFFLSDRGPERRLNVWTSDLAGQGARQLTHYTDYDIDLPSIGPGGVVFAEGGQLHLLDLASNAVHDVPVAFPPGARPAPHDEAVAKFLRRADIAHQPDYAISPDGDTAVVAARGELFAVTRWGSARNLTGTPGVAEDHPAVSPDGRTLAFISDEAGTEQLMLMPLGGGSGSHRLTALPSSALYRPRWSPDGLSLAVADGNKRLWLIDARTGHQTLVAASRYDEIHDAAFSPDSRRLAYSVASQPWTRSLHVRELASGVDTAVPPTFASDHDPAFTNDGRLVFVSARHERPFLADRDREGTIASVASDGIYAATLDVGGRPDIAGLSARAVELTATSTGGFGFLEVAGGTLFYRASAVDTLGDDLPGQQTGLRALDLPTGKDREVGGDVKGHVPTPDGHAALVQRGGALRFMALDAAGAGPGQALILDNLHATVDPAADAREMTAQAWRLDRDLFWDPGMNGVDWPAVRSRYDRLVPEIARACHQSLS